MFEFKLFPLDYKVCDVENALVKLSVMILGVSTPFY